VQITEEVEALEAATSPTVGGERDLDVVAHGRRSEPEVVGRPGRE
jgi:hypothetical protein